MLTQPARANPIQYGVRTRCGLCASPRTQTSKVGGQTCRWRYPRFPMPMIWSKRPEEWVICSGNFTRCVAASGMTPAKTSRWSGADIAILPVPQIACRLKIRKPCADRGKSFMSLENQMEGRATLCPSNSRKRRPGYWCQVAHAPILAGSHVVETAREFEPQRAGHARSREQADAILQDLTFSLL